MNLEQLQQQYRDYKMQLLTVGKLKKQKESVETQIDHAQTDIAQYGQQLTDVRKQLNKMEKFSFINTFRTWTGKQDELFEQQYDALAATELKLVEAQLMAEDLNDDCIDIVYKINAINEPYTLKQIQAVERQIEQYVAMHNPQTAAKLQDQLHQHTLIEQLLIEIEEACVAGEEAERALVAAAEAMKKAKTSSTWDTFLGGGIVATAVKYDNLDKSKSYLHEAQLALQRFKNELLDMQEMKAGSFKIETDGFVKFADYFFDDIFSAWSVHSKISTSLTQISHVLDDVRNTMRALQQKRVIAEDKKQYLLAQREEILANDQQIL